MVFSRTLDISHAKNDREAIAQIAQHIAYMQEAIEQQNSKLLKELQEQKKLAREAE